MRRGYLVIVVILSGCSTQEIYQPPEYTQRVYTNEKPVGLDNTVTWSKTHRSGAAYNQENYRHILGVRNVAILSDHAPEPAQITLSSEPAEAVERTIKSYSVYESQRWERFCGAAKMDSRDWDFISTEGRENLPDHFKQNCTPPAFTRQDYLSAWAASCGNATPLSKGHKIIRNSTLPPKGRCDG